MTRNEQLIALRFEAFRCYRDKLRATSEQDRDALAQKGRQAAEQADAIEFGVRSTG